jgi:hypothetical protein
VNYVNDFPPRATSTTPGTITLTGDLSGTYNSPNVSYSANIPTHVHTSLARPITPIWHTNNMVKQTGTGTFDLMYDSNGDWYGNRSRGNYSGTNFTIILNENAYLRIRKGTEYPSFSTDLLTQSYGSRQPNSPYVTAGWQGQPVSFNHCEAELSLTLIQDDVGGWTPTVWAFGNGNNDIMSSIPGYTPSSGTANQVRFLSLKWAGPWAAWHCVYDSGWHNSTFITSPSSARGGQYIRTWPGLTTNAALTNEQWIDYHVKATTLNLRKWFYNAGIAWSPEWRGGPGRSQWMWADSVTSTGAVNSSLAGPGTSHGGWCPAAVMNVSGVASSYLGYEIPVGSTLHEAGHTLDNYWYAIQTGTVFDNASRKKLLSDDAQILDIHARCLAAGYVYVSSTSDNGHSRQIGEWFAEVSGSWMYTKYLLSIGADPAVGQPIPYRSGSYFSSANSYAAQTLPTTALRDELYARLDTLLAALI